jgi:tRNA(Ile)-lysidine synthetase-like protein
MDLIRDWWFQNPNVWFGSTESDDIEITTKFEHMFELVYDENYLIENISEGIGYIILHDQIARHVKRAKQYPEQFVLDKLDKILGFVEKFYSRHMLNLSGYDFCFVLLPLRHTNIFSSQLFVINETWKKLSCYNVDISNPDEQVLIQIYRNYLKASYERASKGNVILFNPDNINDNELDNIQDTCIYLPIQIGKFISNFLDILDTSCHNYKYDSNTILINDHDTNNFIIKEISRLKNNFHPNLILSISGGVDSMVLSWILSSLGINYVMTHINYANRGEQCEKEKKMLGTWARYLGVKLYYRDIGEINRPKCMEWDLRNLYETYTRDARYQSYIDVAESNGWDDGTWGVLLAHNHDDCVENIFTNIVNKTKYENLYGMEFISTIDFKSNKLNFVRPMLTVSKEQIYNFAHDHNIPYLFDSTPKWSQRGQIRDTIRPALISWNKSSIDGFDKLSNVLADCIGCVDMLVETWYNKLIWFDELASGDKICIDRQKICMRYKFRVIKIKIDDLKPNKIFWSRFLDKIYSSSTNSKCIDEFICRLEQQKKKFSLLQIKQLSLIHMGNSYNYLNKKVNNKKIYYWKTYDNFIIFGFDIA